MSTEASHSISNRRKFSVPVADEKITLAVGRNSALVRSDTSNVPNVQKEPNRLKVKQKTPVERSLSNSQYEELFSTVSARVLSGEILNESYDHLFKGTESVSKKKRNKAKRKEKENIPKMSNSIVANSKTHSEVNENDADENTEKVDYAELFANTVSNKSPNISKHDNEITPHTSPFEENEERSLLKQPEIPKKKQTHSKSMTTKRTSLGYDQKCTKDDNSFSIVGENIRDTFAETGTWVQCVSCNKWRYLASCSDPSSLVEQWTCNMNDECCSNPEENWEEESSQDCFIYTQFRPGSIVWAKLAGYPPWPAMVDTDPDCNMFCDSSNDGSVHQYHVVFLDDRVSRAWVNHRFVEPYRSNETPVKSNKSGKHQDYEKYLETAKSTAQGALKMSMEDRVAKYRFETRFCGKSHWSSSKNVDQKKRKQGAKIEKDKMKSSNLKKKRKEPKLQEEKNSVEEGESNSEIKDNTKDQEKEPSLALDCETFTTELEKEEEIHEIIQTGETNKVSAEQTETAPEVNNQDNSETTPPSPIKKDDYWSVSVSQSSEVLFKDLGMIEETDDQPVVREDTSWDEFEQLVME